MTLLFLYLALAVGVSFLCSVLEAVLLSMTPSFVGSLEDSGAKAGKMVREMKADVERPLAAILSLNTMAHTIGAAGVGAQAQIVFVEASITIVSIVVTLLILVLSEIIPKTLGASWWRELAVPSAYIIRFIVIALYPLVIFSLGITRLMARKVRQATVNREEISAMAEIGQKEGVLDEAETRTLRSVIGFHNARVQDVLTPRIVTLSLPASMTVGEAMDQYPDLRFSRIPLRGEDPDDITGYVMKDDILAAAARGDRDDVLGDRARKAIIVPEQSHVGHVMREFLKTHEHMAIVVDEFGGFAGIVTLEDIIETLIGSEIMDELDQVEDMRKLARDVERGAAD